MSTKVKKDVISCPRFWDLHIHGVAGIDFMHATLEEIREACELLGAQGIGFFAPTLLTAERKVLEGALKRWGDFFGSNPKLSKSAAVPVGLHLEGPFLNPEMGGAHPRSALAKPNPKLLAAWHKLSRGWIAILTLAPELSGSVAVVKEARKLGIHVQLGHTKAGSKEIEAAIEAGASGVTHLFNAMKVHHREPGVLPYVLRGELVAELVCDGEHVHPDYVLWALAASGGSLYAVTDACSALEAKKNLKCTLGDLEVKRAGRVAVVASGSLKGTLAGGATRMTEHPRGLARGVHHGETLPRETVREILGLFHEHQRRIILRTACGARLRQQIESAKGTLSFSSSLELIG